MEERRAEGTLLSPIRFLYSFVRRLRRAARVIRNVQRISIREARRGRPGARKRAETHGDASITRSLKDLRRYIGKRRRQIYLVGREGTAVRAHEAPCIAYGDIRAVPWRAVMHIMGGRCALAAGANYSIRAPPLIGFRCTSRRAISAYASRVSLWRKGSAFPSSDSVPPRATERGEARARSRSLFAISSRR